jgi:hypothetical protein
MKKYHSRTRIIVCVVGTPRLTLSQPEQALDAPWHTVFADRGDDQRDNVIAGSEELLASRLTAKRIGPAALESIFKLKYQPPGRLNREIGPNVLK